jgi:AcrR family transcriptional regulator
MILPETAPAMRTLDPSRREQILETAARLFDRRRYHEVRMEDLAVAAGVAKGTLYRYFDDKEALYVALLVSALDRFYREMVTAMEAVDCPERKVRVFLNSSVTFFDEHPYFFDLLQRVESSVNVDRIRELEELRESFFRLVTEIIRELIATGRYTAPDPLAAAMILTGINRQMHRFYPKPWPEGLADGIADFFLRGMTKT